MTLNEKISAWFEPKPPTPPWKESTARLMLHVINPDSWKGTQSEKRYWLWDDVRWQPLDYDTDEAANGRLLDAMRARFPYMSITFDSYGTEFELSGKPGGWCETFKETDRKKAVVRAFCKVAEIDKERAIPKRPRRKR